MTTMAIDKTCETVRPGADATGERTWFRPAVDIRENTTELTILSDMPGVAREDVDIQFENGTLTIHGGVHPRKNDAVGLSRNEYELGDYRRSFRVGERINPAGIHASLANGVLTVHLPKVAAPQPRKITVRAD